MFRPVDRRRLGGFLARPPWPAAITARVSHALQNYAQLASVTTILAFGQRLRKARN